MSTEPDRERHECEYCRHEDSPLYAMPYRIGPRIVWLCGFCHLNIVKRAPAWLPIELSLAPQNREQRRWQRRHESQIRTAIDRLFAGARNP